MKLPAPRFGQLARFLALPPALFLAGAALAHGATQTFAEWAAARGFTGSQAIATADPDGNGVTNFGEYAFGYDAAAPGSPLPVVTPPAEGSDYIVVTFGKGAAAAGSVSYTIQESTDLMQWTDLTLAMLEGTPNDYYTPVTVLVDRAGRPSLYVRVFASLNSPPAVSGPVPPSTPLTTASPPIQVGTSAYIQSINGDPAGGGADSTRYPQAAGTERVAVTDYATSPMNSGPVRRRSWLGGFLWGDGVPPASDQAADWDYNWWSSAAMAWISRRLDQQPIYADPLIINYNWPPGQFGFASTPGQYGVPTGFPANHTIVRGVNIGEQFPYMKQAVAFNPNVPSAWQLSPLQTMTRPTETIVLVPSNLSPTQLVSNTTGNNQTNGGDAYPWPVWNGTQPISQQIPWNIMVDRMGDFDADLVYEATNPTDPNYATNRYTRASATAAYTGNYLKMTVAQGSPFVFCEQNNFAYANLYNLIRPNDLSGNTAQTASNPRVLGPFPVTGAANVSYVLLTADQLNPDQSYPGQGPDASDNAHSLNPIGQQHNYAYYAVYYITDAVQTVGAGNSGTDSQGNPYFYLEFTNGNQHNYYAIAALPAFRYYDADANSGNVTGATAARDAAAQTYAAALGGYAFNFITGTQISKRVLNSNQVLTFFDVKTAVPTLSDNLVSAANTTVLALKPHHYQPIGLGRDLGNSTISWKTLLPDGYTPPGGSTAMTDYADFTPVTDTSGLANANQGRWGYWTVVGNLKTIAGSKFGTQYLFNNFLPALPPPNWDEEYSLTGLQGIQVSAAGSGYQAAVNPQITIQAPAGGGTTAVANSETSFITGAVGSIGLTNIGSGYTNTGSIPIAFAPPPVNANLTANALAGNYTVTGGAVTNITVSQAGSGYTSAPDVVIFDPSGAGFGAEATAEISGGAVTGINITAGGTGYPGSGVVIAIGPSPGGNQYWRVAKGYGNFYADGVGSITITDQGAGYGPSLEITAADGDPGTGAVGRVFIDGGGTVTQISIISGGADYISAPTLVVHGTGTGATATAQVAGTVAGFVAGTGSGSGYFSAPTLTISAPNAANGTQATGNFTLSPLGSLLGLALNASGSGYTSAPNITFSGGGSNVTTVAAATANLSGDGVSQINVLNGGTGYTSAPTITFSGGGTPTTTASAVANVNGGRVVSIFLTNGGAGYTSAPTLTLAPPGGNGTTATAYAVMSPGAVTSINITAGGTNYTAGTSIQFSSPTGVGGVTAVANAIVTNGTVTGVQIINGGSGYETVPTLTISGGNNNATATAALSNNFVSGFLLTNAGAGYTSAPTVSFSGGGGTGANATAFLSNGITLNLTNAGSGYSTTPSFGIVGGTEPNIPTVTGSAAFGQISSTVVTNVGTSSYSSPPTVVFVGGAGASDATATATLSGNTVGGITITHGGANYTAAPLVAIAPPGGNGTLATATASISGGVVTNITVTNPGSGYSSAPQVFVGGSAGGAATVMMSGSPVSNASVSAGGTGYAAGTTISFSAPQIGNTSLAATLTVSGGVITGITVTNAGAGYTSTPTYTFANEGAGTGAVVDLTLANNIISYLEITDAGVGYVTPPQVVFSGGGGAGAAATAQIGGLTSINITNAGGPFTTPPTVSFNAPSAAAALSPVVQNVTVGNVTTNGVITGVQILSPGYGYNAVPAITVTGGSGTGATSASFNVTLNATTGGIQSVTVLPGQGGSNYTLVPPTLTATQTSGNQSALYSSPSALALLDSSGNLSSILITNAGGGYTAANPPVIYVGGPLNMPAPIAPTGPGGSVATLEIVGGSEQIGQILYDSMGSQFKTLAVASNQPWGGFFGQSSVDTYGVGGKLSAAAQGITILYHLQRYQLETSGLDVPPASWPVKIYNTGVNPTFANDAPNVTLKGALQTWVTQLQDTLDVFFQGGGNTSIFTNSPPEGSGFTGQWQMQYFAGWDADAHRMILYPTGTNPIPFVGSANNSAANYTPTGAPPTPVPENLPPGNVWAPGKMFNGFGFADQFNDHHYFYGYYLATAGVAAIFDQSWVPAPSPANATWARATGLGGAIDQLVMTLAYDPDTPGFNQFSQMQYPKFAFFDQWNGHAWAAGLTPGPGGGGSGASANATLTGNSVTSISIGAGGTNYLSPPQIIIAPPPGGGAQATAYATVAGGAVTNITVLNPGSGYSTAPPVVILGGAGSGMQALGLNENSNYEGVQAWAGTILWAAGTQRRSVFDLGLYLYATNTFSGDFYLFDKNYNQVDPTVLDGNSEPYNAYSFVPRITGTTGDAGNTYPAGSTYWSAASYNYTGNTPVSGEPIASGGAIEYQGSNAVTTFFGPYPMSSRLIQALPPAPWTFPMGRNPDYMLGWGLPMFTDKWASMNGTVLMPSGYQTSLDQSVAIGGLPHSTGQVPSGGNVTPVTVATLPTSINTYISNWVVDQQGATALPIGTGAALQPNQDVSTVLNWFHIVDFYGTPDWTVYAVPTSANRMVFTSAFTKDGATTLVGFNPGFTTITVNFHRLQHTSGGSTIETSDPQVGTTMTIPPKQMIVQTVPPPPPPPD